jgi:PAS domain S-box-containing protein
MTSMEPTLEEVKQRVTELEEKYRMLFNNSIFSISTITPDGVILALNPVSARHLGGRPEDLIGKSITEILPRLAEKTMARIRDVVASGKTVVYDSFIDTEPEGGWFETEYQPMKNAKGEVTTIQIVAQDITRRKVNDERIAIFQKIAAIAQQGFGMTDLKGNFTYVNRALCRQLGEKTHQDIVGKNLRAYYPEKHRQKLEQEALPTVMEKGHWTGELDFSSADGKTVHTIQNLFLVRDKSQNPFFLAFVVTDMTDHRRLEKVLMQREKMQILGAIAAEVSHEIRNPLVSIGGFAQRLKNKFPDLTECDIILKESKRLERILSRIGDFLDPIEFHPQKCSVDQILHECLSIVSPEIGAKQIQCILHPGPQLPMTYVDPQILVQVFIHLIHDMIGAVPYGGELIIRFYETPQDIHIEFKNPAPSSTVKYPESLFLPFAEENHGMGLPLCYRLLKDMGGLLTFEQEAGSASFVVSIPKKTKEEE